MRVLLNNPYASSFIVGTMKHVTFSHDFFNKYIILPSPEDILILKISCFWAFWPDSWKKRKPPSALNIKFYFSTGLEVWTQQLR